MQKQLIFALKVGIIYFIMKILVITDTHRQVNNAKKVLFDNPDITNVIHLGDLVRDAEQIQEEFPDKTFHIVKGNNDWMDFARENLILSLCGHNIFATHGHAFGVKGGYTLLARHAKSMGCDLALFGHTHSYADEVVDGVRCLNPSNNGYFVITKEEITFYKY